MPNDGPLQAASPEVTEFDRLSAIRRLSTSETSELWDALFSGTRSRKMTKSALRGELSEALLMVVQLTSLSNDPYSTGLGSEGLRKMTERLR